MTDPRFVRLSANLKTCIGATAKSGANYRQNYTMKHSRGCRQLIHTMGGQRDRGPRIEVSQRVSDSGWVAGKSAHFWHTSAHAAPARLQCNLSFDGVIDAAVWWRHRDSALSVNRRLSERCNARGYVALFVYNLISEITAVCSIVALNTPLEPKIN